MRKISNIFIVLAIILSNVMCAVVAYLYCNLQWGGKYAGYSAPAWLAFYYAIPYGISILICISIAIVLRKRESK